MKFKDFVKQRENRNKIVRFKKEYFEDSPVEVGMVGVIISLSEDDDLCVKILFDMDYFITYNKPLQDSNYYDENRIPCLTAMEAGMWESKAGAYFEGDDNVEDYLELLTQEQVDALDNSDASKLKEAKKVLTWWVEERMKSYSDGQYGKKELKALLENLK